MVYFRNISKSTGFEMRLSLFIARAGLASRRKAEEMILHGRVKVNGYPVTTLGSKVDPEQDRVACDGKPIRSTESSAVYAVHKPAGVISAASDNDRLTVLDQLPRGKRLYPVGRLDLNTTGLLLVTNDGELCHRLTHPSYGIEKVYEVTCEGPLSTDDVTSLLKGVRAEGEKYQADKVQVKSVNRWRTHLLITLHEGKKRHIRVMLEAIRHPVQKLRRVQYGPISLGRLGVGQFRQLTKEEVGTLRKAVGLDRV